MISSFRDVIVLLTTAFRNERVQYQNPSDTTIYYDTG